MTCSLCKGTGEVPDFKDIQKSDGTVERVWIKVNCPQCGGSGNDTKNATNTHHGQYK